MLYARGLPFLQQSADARVHSLNSGRAGLVSRLSSAGGRVAAFLEEELHQVARHRALGEAAGLEANESPRPGHAVVEDGVACLK